jgi:anthranilate synthase component I
MKEMKIKYQLEFNTLELHGDTITPVGVYLRLRDVYPCSLLLECTDYSSRTNAFSYICLMPVLGIEASGENLRTYFPGNIEYKNPLSDVVQQVNDFLESIEIKGMKDNSTVHGLFGFTSFDSALLFEKFKTTEVQKVKDNREVPFLKYDFFRIILTFNHYNDTLTLTEYFNDDLPEKESDKVLSILANHNFTGYPFSLEEEEQSFISDQSFKNMVSEGVRHCALGDVFQLVVSRRYRHKFIGDEFNVYRALRSVNPSPYLFYFDYITYKIFGSSPEAQIKVQGGKAAINPIAGTIRRSGNTKDDLVSARELLENPKENSEHVMLVDLARNDLSRSCTNVKVDIYKEVQTFSHLLHLVSTVSGDLPENVSPFTVFAKTFPAGTLSGAPKHKAIELINNLESISRGYYGGAIGFIGLDKSLNQAIMIRSFFSRDGYLNFQAGAGIVINSSEEGELNEVSNKLDALRTAMKRANNYIKF